MSAQTKREAAALVLEQLGWTWLDDEGRWRQPNKQDAIVLKSILSARTKRGLVEMHLNGEHTQMEVGKARHVATMLHEAIEAAISDELIHRFLERLGVDGDRAALALNDFREMRQGSRDTVDPN